jgi:hypothetical protein
MSFDLAQLEKEAKKIRLKLKAGELVDGCCMSPTQSPAREAWEIAEELTDNNPLSIAQRLELLSKLGTDIQSQLQATGYDDFDLVYERLLHVALLPSAGASAS